MTRVADAAALRGVLEQAKGVVAVLRGCSRALSYMLAAQCAGVLMARLMGGPWFVGGIVWCCGIGEIALLVLFTAYRREALRLFADIRGMLPVHVLTDGRGSDEQILARLGKACDLPFLPTRWGPFGYGLAAVGLMWLK